ncbi:MAG: NAD(P)H-quinone oxidoreductase [Rhodospirillaceae bacterium]|nr:NAD(P)H-quinone oxidoreductase [Rhodospirillaceae bacterium]|tara:strand:- start:242 stop:1246 length:1005 start_codon:yes stop_codon:yes gene_type:complete
MSLPETMTVVEISEYGGPEVLKPASRPVPEPASGEALIRVTAAGVNRPDAIQRAGNYPPPAGQSDLPGLEVSGEIVALGDGASGVSIGDTVCALTPGGGYAEYCIAPASHCLPVPDGISVTDAAGIPETSFTVWHNVFQRAYLQKGERFLVHGGSSGIGTTAIQLAKAFGAEVFTTAGSREKCDACEALGADLAINYKEEDWVAVLREKTEKQGVDVILDMVGGSYIQKNIDSLNWDGRLSIIAFLTGAKAELMLARFMVKRQTMTASTLRAQSDAAKAAIAAELREKVWPLFASGKVKPVIDSVLPLSEAAKAHERMESSTHIGKIILQIGST